MDIRPTNSTLAAIVRGVDVRTLTAAAFANLEAAWNEHAVLIIPGQHLDDEAHIAFSRRFGSHRRRASGHRAQESLHRTPRQLHRGLPYPADQRRIMCRTTVAGDQSDNKWVLNH